MSTTTDFRRLTVEEVRRAREKTGATIVRGLYCEIDEGIVRACPIGVVALAEHGHEWDGMTAAADRLGLHETYRSHFVEAFDYRHCPPPPEESRAILGNFDLAMAGWQDARAIARALFGEEAAA